MDKPVVRISVRNLVEFILRSGDLDNRGGSSDREAMQKGSRLHRKIQGRMGSHYRAEVSLKYKTEYEDVGIQVEGRADGIFTEDGQCWIDEIKGVYADVSQLEKPVEVHRAQAMCYAWIYAQEQKPEKIGVQMTYGNLDTEELKFFREEYTLEELGLWYQNLLDRYHKWIAYQLAWKKERNASMSDLEFPFEYREGQRKIVSGVYHTISTERQIFANLKELARDNIVLLISHRLYLFPEMDQIIWMENGKAKVDTHENLLREVPEYRELFEEQEEKGGRES